MVKVGYSLRNKLQVMRNVNTILCCPFRTTTIKKTCSAAAVKRLFPQFKSIWFSCWFSSRMHTVRCFCNAYTMCSVAFPTLPCQCQVVSTWNCWQHISHETSAAIVHNLCFKLTWINRNVNHLSYFRLYKTNVFL